MYVCDVCMHTYMYVCMSCMYAMNVCMYACMKVLYACVYVMYVCLSVCVYVCVSMYVCMYIYIYVCHVFMFVCIDVMHCDAIWSKAMLCDVMCACMSCNVM